MKPTQFLLVSIFLLVACASAPKIEYYTLGTEPSGKIQPAANLKVERLGTSETLARNRILIFTSATKIEYYATDQWAGSLGELVQQKLQAEFGPVVDGKRNLSLSGTVLACEQVDVPNGAEARLKLHIVLRESEKKRYEKPLLDRIYEARRYAARPEAASVVVALAQCAEQIAAEIAEDVSQL